MARRPLRKRRTWGRYHGGRRPSSDASLHSPTVIPPSALDKPSITKPNDEVRCDCTFADDGNASWHSVCRVPMAEWRLDCRHLTVVGLHDTGPWVVSLFGVDLFSRWKNTRDLPTGTPVATLPGAWCCRLQWLPCQAPGVIGSELGLTAPVLVDSDWVEYQVWSATSIWVWQHVQLSEQIRLWDRLGSCRDVSQPTNICSCLSPTRPPRWPSGKASASRAEDPGFESRLRRDFFVVESYQWLKNRHSSSYPARRLAL